MEDFRESRIDLNNLNCVSSPRLRAQLARFYADLNERKETPTTLARRIKASGSFFIDLPGVGGVLRLAHLWKGGISSFDPAVHALATDVYVVLDGSADIALGGKLLGGERRQGDIEDTIRGIAIDGGVTRRASRGSVFEIPPGVSHAVRLTPDDTEVLFLNIKESG